MGLFTVLVRCSFFFLKGAEVDGGLIKVNNRTEGGGDQNG